MPLILELMCPGCSNAECQFHQSMIKSSDAITGLEIEVRCICSNCNQGVKK